MQGGFLSGTARLYGIRHHGPGSARSLVAALDEWKPDRLLIEGPEEADALLPFLVDPALEPPIAMLFYDVEQPRYASYYPLAEFSPELQAVRWAHRHGVPVQWMDLPATNRLAVKVAIDRVSNALDAVAQAAGFEDTEDWWEAFVEVRANPTSIFQSLETLMAALRQSDEKLDVPEQEDDPDDRRPSVPLTQYEEIRENCMCGNVAKAEKSCDRPAAICGAWHLPALKAAQTRSDANKLPRSKVGATIVPWTYDLLTTNSGYGAGARSPAFYELIWNTPQEALTRKWLLSVARLMREEDLDASPASVIEAVRLSDALAALRERARPGLRELGEAANAVLVRDEAVWALIGRKLIVGERLGKVPDHVPAVPLQSDIQRLQKRLRMPTQEGSRELDLDLRGDMDLERSHFLHRLRLLDIEWGAKKQVTGKKGTFHEHWALHWQPSLAIAVIQASVWGNTVSVAATARATRKIEDAATLSQTSDLLNECLLSSLEGAISPALEKLENMSATVADVADLGDALPSLAAMIRYGTVRRIDTSHLAPVLSAVFTRFCLGLPGGCRSLDDDAAAAMSKRLSQTAAIVPLLGGEQQLALWQDALRQIATGQGIHAVLWGKAERIRFDMGLIQGADLADRLRLEASVGSDALHMAAFIEGLLEGPGTILIHQEELRVALDQWLSGLTPEAFDEVLPLIRRTFALFTKPERRQLGELVGGKVEARREVMEWDEERGRRVLPVIRQILGVKE